MKKFWNWIHDDGGGRILRLEGPIDSENFWGDEITPAMFREDLEAEDGDVTVWINSPGGNVFAAAEIYTMLRDYAGKVTVKIASLAASAASVVAMAGDTVQMSPTALLMVHDPSTIAMGNTRDMEKAIAALNEVKEAIVNAYDWTSAGYVPKQNEVPMVRMVFELYAEGLKIERIREKVEAAGYSSFRGKVSHRFITRMLDDERYSGRRTVNGEAIENDHEAIIDPELFARVQELRAISWQKQARRLATNKAKREAEHGKNSDGPAADDQP